MGVVETHPTTEIHETKTEKIKKEKYRKNYWNSDTEEEEYDDKEPEPIWGSYCIPSETEDSDTTEEANEQTTNTNTAARL